MIDLPDLLDSARICCHCDIQSKKRALQTVAELLGEAIRTPADLAEGQTGDSLQEPAGNEPATATENPDPAENELSDMDVLDALIVRERLGSTGLGHGVALPHSRMASIEKPLAAMITLNEGVDFDAADGEPVDLVLGLLVPQECNDEHLKILAGLARRFSDAELRDKLRSFSTSEELLEHLKNTAAT
jgi:PTS system nitrogen regulatory IIA component